jgi:hypothetical protein
VRFGLGLAELLMLSPLLAPVLFVIVSIGRRARRLGYRSRREYLRAAPRTDAEKRDAVDMAFKGLVLSATGLLFPPFVLIGLLPLFYGGRKLVYASMGLGLIDDADEPGA